MGKTARYTTRKLINNRLAEVNQMDTEVQPKPPHENGSKIVESSSDPPGETSTNGTDVLKTPQKALLTRETRSRSRTPQTKKDKKGEDNSKPQLKVIDESLNGHEEKKTRSSEKNKAETEDDSKNSVPKEDNVSNDEKVAKETKKSATKSKDPELSSDASDKPIDNDKAIETVESEVSTKSGDPVKPEAEVIDMDPLILAGDEPDPELQFDENSDMDSVKGSPIQSRCKTRRSHTRNVPTPKTPKSVTDSESEKNSVAPTPTPENLNDTADSLNIEDISTKAEAGSDYLASNTSIFSDDNSYLNYTRERSLTETLRGLSSRKTIRPLNDSYRLKAFKNTQNKSDLNLPFPNQDRTTGLKRRRSPTPEQRKRHRSDSTSFVSYLSNPLNNFRNKIASDVSSSTPKLTGYKDGSKNIHEEIMYSEVLNEEPEKKNWCSVM